MKLANSIKKGFSSKNVFYNVTQCFIKYLCYQSFEENFLRSSLRYSLRNEEKLEKCQICRNLVPRLQSKN